MSTQLSAALLLSCLPLVRAQYNNGGYYRHSTVGKVAGIIVAIVVIVILAMCLVAIARRRRVRAMQARGAYNGAGSDVYGGNANGISFRNMFFSNKRKHHPNNAQYSNDHTPSQTEYARGGYASRPVASQPSSGYVHQNSRPQHTQYAPPAGSPGSNMPPPMYGAADGTGDTYMGAYSPQYGPPPGPPPKAHTASRRNYYA